VRAFCLLFIPILFILQTNNISALNRDDFCNQAAWGKSSWEWQGTQVTRHYCRTEPYGSDGKRNDNLSISNFIIHPNSTSVEKGYLTIYTNVINPHSKHPNANYFLEINNQNYTLPNPLNNPPSSYLIADGGVRIITNQIVERGSDFKISLKGGPFDPKVSPGWSYGASSFPASDEKLAQFFNKYQTASNGVTIDKIAHISWADSDHAGINWDYYDFDDLPMIIAISPLDPPPPSCNVNQVNLREYNSPVSRGKSLRLVATKNTTILPSNNVAFTSISNPPQLTNCSFNNTSNLIERSNCIVTGQTGTYSWSVGYRIYNTTGTKFNNCTATSTFQIQDPPGYVITKGGDVYIKGINSKLFNMPSYLDYSWNDCKQSNINLRKNCISEYLLTHSLSSFLDTFTHNRFIRRDYYDQNNSLVDFDKIKSEVLKKANQYGVQIMKSNEVNLFNPTNNQRRVIEVTGNLSIAKDTVCNTNSIYLISGNLTINPNFTISTNDQKNKGCLFIINGNLTINIGGNQGSDKYDLVHGFFILTGQNSSIIVPEDNYELLRIIGGVVTKDNIELKSMSRKSLGVFDGSKYILPASEEIIYEGARYRSLFGDLLTNYMLQYSIREKI
jgi:hypothetical protein